MMERIVSSKEGMLMQDYDLSSNCDIVLNLVMPATYKISNFFL